jgi:Rrf2 family transcriptional regulator, iron-responsive regulator
VLQSYTIADLASKKRSIRERLGLSAAEVVMEPESALI